MVNGGAAPGFKRRDVEFQARVLTPLRRASEAKSHGVMKLVQIPRYRAELSVDRACRGGPWCRRDVAEHGLHKVDARTPVEAMARVGMAQPVGRG